MRVSLRKNRAAAPGSEEVMSYRMPAFRLHGMLAYYAGFRDHGSFLMGSSTLRRKFARELKPFAYGRETMRFTPVQPLPAALVKKIVREWAIENQARVKRKARLQTRAHRGNRSALGRIR